MQREQKSKRKEAAPELILGWKVVNKDLEPEAWLSGRPKTSRQLAKHLVQCPGESIAHHTIIVAQSGSGKSFFLGRIIEEILLRTKSRVLILDPNSDFRKFSETVAAEMWTDSTYDRTKKSGYLPHESSRQEFEAPWILREKRLYSASSKPPVGSTLIQPDWLKFNVDWFSDDTDLVFQSALRHCHTFMNELFEVISISKLGNWREEHELLEFGQTFCRETRDLSRDTILRKLFSAFDPYALGSNFRKSESELFRKATKDEYRQHLAPRLTHAAICRSFVPEAVEKFYFSKAQEAKESGVFATQIPIPPLEPVRAHILDLPSIREPYFRLMAVSNFLSEEWVLARKNWEIALDKNAKSDTRVPIFIVIDEAHNLIPEKASDRGQRRLQEQFRTIAAEGRKFGVFLILISQRPDKLDPLVVSECENRAIMKMSSEVVLDKTNDLLGLDKATRTKAKDCLKFHRGRVLLCGPWAKGGSVFLYSAMRRTEEGGRDLQKEYWATP